MQTKQTVFFFLLNTLLIWSYVNSSGLILVREMTGKYFSRTGNFKISPRKMVVREISEFYIADI